MSDDQMLLIAVAFTAALFAVAFTWENRKPENRTWRRNLLFGGSLVLAAGSGIIIGEVPLAWAPAALIGVGLGVWGWNAFSRSMKAKEDE